MIRFRVRFVEPSLARCFEILGVMAGVTEKELREAYRKTIKQYHPDKTVGLGDELRQLAEEKSKEINLAYGRIVGIQG